ncbi:DUF3300 domain-containing protein [Rheinheimera riviphila]|uniref:DUF3300 domain-containing protein n=1 Tax=Rheinheimera riviphila TaxID=1834037 RepID=A0A437R255_9GAMM|nr:DUF3300 domain-containing protein [Rheinheimera riviphila]RVU40864.1 DUF3300 domain-containing protein [Rheinheimera riviphila]
MNGVGFSLSIFSLALALTGTAVSAQTTPDTGTPIQANAAAVTFSQAELDQMLAPIALYPDTVLSHILIAATYPLEIVKATRWLSAQSAMTSEQALKAAENEPWDPSVRALVAFPPLLTKMNNELEWTQKLGDAFLIQEAQLMATVQALRERAYASGHLKDQEHITVQRQEKVIVIEPRTPEVVYVPVYDTRVVYGDWMWREYPPIHWPYPDYHSGGSYVYWGVGARVSSAFYFSTFYWPQRQIVVINHHRPNYYHRHHDIVRHEERRHWRHNPKHRHGVVYHQSYQPTREMRGQGYQQADVGERRRWAADQRQRNNISVPEDRRVREQYPEQQRATVINHERSGTDIDRDRLRQHREGDPQRHQQRSRELDVVNGQQAENPAAERQINVDAGRHQDNSREMRGRIEQTEPLNSDQPTRERSVYSAPERVESVERPAIDTAEPIRRERPVYETPRVERQERPVYEAPKPIERQERPVYDAPRPIERQERPVYEAPRPIERQERPVYEAPRPIERQEPVYEAPRPIERQEPVYEAPRPIERAEPAYEAPRPIERPQPSFQASRQFDRPQRQHDVSRHDAGRHDSGRQQRQRTSESRGSIE